MASVSLFSLLATFVALFIAYRVYATQALRLKARKLGCQSAPRYKHKDPFFGLDLFLRTGDAMTKHEFLVEHQRRYDTYGHTFEALNFGSHAIYSVHPENLRAVWSKNAADWGIQPLRLHNMHPFCGSGFITTDGPEWKLSHALLKPGFHKSNISDFTGLEEHLKMMLGQIPKDGSKFDLQPWIIKLYLDMNTLFLFGEPIGMLSGSPPPHAEGFLDAFQAGFNGCGMRIALGPLKVLLPKGSWLKACKKVHKFADVYVDRALEYREKHKHEFTTQDGEAPTKQRTLLYNMAQQTDNKTILRDQIIQAMMAATETTASLISTVIQMLATHPAVFANLRTEILALGTESLSFDRLTRIKYLQNIITETLRLYPVFPQNNRVALRDTVLPMGGGPDGKAPIFAPAGTLFDTCFATLHRDKKIWGPDAEEFRPSRWDSHGGFAPSLFEFMPFGAGLRQCLAQQKATMEASYIVVRMLQEFKEIRSEDDRPYQAQVALTAKNANGCLVSLIPVA
ncbi:cytochrome P450 [Lentithecium fluviatile CBS 122367]|uniref:Cytochrome P450 n=1 Tax=Lentithecium fluviatile CBS 122367 TaxID=1168545 RepID=A0A6G1JAK0_9PLEO|nr:cytochrome P450 [Lentithecium fluviatile CBS 122367]